MTRVILPPKKAGSNVKFEIDFAGRIPLGVTISSATVTAAVHSGTDGSPSAIVSGAATVSGTKVTQRIIGGVAGTIYDLTWTATLSDSQTPTIQTYLAMT